MKSIPIWVKRLVVWIPLTCLLAMSIVAIIRLNTNITETARFQAQMVTDKYEGSLSENLGFLTMLTTEIANDPTYKKMIEDEETNTAIKDYLEKLRNKLEFMEPPSSAFPITKDSNIDTIDDPDVLKSWLHKDTLGKINYRQLNLEPSIDKQDTYFNFTVYRPFLRSLQLPEVSQKKIKSYVHIPAPLVAVINNDASLSETVKNEVVFSKVIEKNLLQAQKDLELKGIWQVYFIPISGSVRIFNNETDNQIEHYKRFFPGIVCFSDRPYFKKTLVAKSVYRVSNLYIDSAGGGLIITHSILIKNKKLAIIGMIGVDRKIGQIGDILANVKMGTDMGPRGFTFAIYPVKKSDQKFASKRFLDKLKKNPLDLAKEYVNNQYPQGLFKSEIIVRIPFEYILPDTKMDNTIYAINLPKTASSPINQVAYFRFSPENTQIKSRNSFFYYSLSLLGIIILTGLAFNFLMSRRKTQKMHEEVVSHLNGGLLILDSEGLIKFHNYKMAQLVEDLSLMEKTTFTTLLTDESRAEYREWVMDGEGNLRLNDFKIAQLIAIPSLVKKNFLTDLLTVESRAEFIDCLKKSPKGFEFSGRISRLDGSVFPAIISNAAITYPGVRNAQMTIVIPSEQLERTIAAEFIHSFSHTLKTPIQSIILLADRLRRKKMPQEKYDHYYSLMKREVDEFTNMVTNLLRFSKLEKEDIRPAKTLQNVALLLKNAAKPFKEKAEKQKITLVEKIPETLMVETDRDLLRVILNNLLENALKYTIEGEINVDAMDTPEEVIISVSDTGCGIPDDEKDKVFERFYRGRAQEVRIKDGIGIGLYISRKYISLLGGTLEYSPNIKKDINERGRVSTLEKGSKFIIHMPKEKKER